MVNTNNLKKGIVLKLDGVLFEVVDHEHYKPGKGGAFVRATLRNLETDNILEKRLPAGEKVEDVFIDKRVMQYLYSEGENCIFMDTENYEQTPISKKVLGDRFWYLKEGFEVIVRFYEEQIIDIELPSHVVLEVTSAPQGVRGDTVGTVMKTIELETGLEIQAPLFVNTGDKVKISTKNAQYVERA